MTTVHHPAPSSHNQSAASVNTSISSVSTEPHTAEPTPRRRVHSPPAPIFDAVKPPRSSSTNDLTVAVATAHRVGSQGTSPVNASTTGSPVRKNNPYMYNVLGEHASPDFASRTSPIPNDALNQTAASSITTSPTFPSSALPPHHPRRHSFDWDEVHQLQQDATGSPAVLGSYMAQCYSSAFPPGHLPKPMAHDVALKSTKSSAQREPGTGRRRGRRGGSNSPHNSSTATVATATTAASPAAAAPVPVAAPVPTPSPAAVAPAQPRAAAHVSSAAADADAAMTRVYRNGRPVPVPTAAACAN